MHKTHQSSTARKKKKSYHVFIIYSSQEVEQPKCPSMNEWIKKCVVHRMEYCSALKKEGNPALCDDTDASKGIHYTQ